MICIPFYFYLESFRLNRWWCYSKNVPYFRRQGLTKAWQLETHKVETTKLCTHKTNTISRFLISENTTIVETIDCKCYQLRFLLHRLRHFPEKAGTDDRAVSEIVVQFEEKYRPTFRKTHLQVAFKVYILLRKCNWKSSFRMQNVQPNSSHTTLCSRNALKCRLHHEGLLQYWQSYHDSGTLYLNLLKPKDI